MYVQFQYLEHILAQVGKETRDTLFKHSRNGSPNLIKIGTKMNEIIFVLVFSAHVDTSKNQGLEIHIYFPHIRHTLK